MTDHDMKAIQNEEMRQADALSRAIQQAIQQTSGTFQFPILNAVAGALVVVEARILASITNSDHRRALQNAMKRERPTALKRALMAGDDPALHVETIQVGGRYDA